MWESDPACGIERGKAKNPPMPEWRGAGSAAFAREATQESKWRAMSLKRLEIAVRRSSESNSRR